MSITTLVSPPEHSIMATMLLMSLTTLPEAVLRLICLLLTPTHALVNDHPIDTIPSIHRGIINFALTCRTISRIARSYIAANISLTDCCVRWDLFLRTVLESPTYAANIKYLKLCEGTEAEWITSRMSHPNIETDHVTAMFRALHQLQVLFSYKGEALYPGSIIWRLTSGSEDMPMKHTLKELQFDHINIWGEKAVVQIQLCRQMDKGQEQGNWVVGGEHLTGKLKGLSVHKLCEWPGVQHLEVTSKDGEDDGDAMSDGDWEDEESEMEWDSDADYESGEEESDWDSEDSSDYEDDWEAEGGILGFKGSIKDLPVPVPSVLLKGLKF
jgi:hypothetical protein